MKRRWIVSVAIVAVAVVLLVAAIPIWSALNDSSGPVTWVAYNPYDSGGTWYKGQVHCHSTNSDGSLSPQQVISGYANLGFRFVALTDHFQANVVKGSSLLVLGQEYERGSMEVGLRNHMNGINLSYSPPDSASAQDRINAITSQNGIAILNHPKAFFYAYSDNSLQTLTNYTGLEVYNANFPLAATGAWDDVLSRGKIVWGFAGDDSHDAKGMGRGWIEVRISGSLTTSNVINAIKHGSFYATQGPLIDDISFNGNTLKIVSSGDSVTFIGPGGETLKTIIGGNATYDTSGLEGYVRAEVSQNGLRAWTQPVFLASKSVSGTSQAAISAELLMADRLF